TRSDRDWSSDVCSSDLAAACGIGNESGRAKVLAALAPHLDGTQLREALAAARGIGDEYHRVRALAGLAPHLGKALRAAAQREARSEERRVGKEWRARGA